MDKLGTFLIEAVIRTDTCFTPRVWFHQYKLYRGIRLHPFVSRTHEPSTYLQPKLILINQIWDESMSSTSFEQIFAIDEEVEWVLLGKLYSLSDYVVEVVSGQVIGHKIPTRNVNKFWRIRNGTHFVLSISGNFEVSDFSQITGILSGYLSLILSASFFLCSTHDGLDKVRIYQSQDELSYSSFYLF